MAYFVVLERADEHGVVAVNPNQIREVYPLNDNSACQLYFAGTNYEVEGPTLAKGTLEQVLHKLRETGS